MAGKPKHASVIDVPSRETSRGKTGKLNPASYTDEFSITRTVETTYTKTVIADTELYIEFESGIDGLGLKTTLPPDHGLNSPFDCDDAELDHLADKLLEQLGLAGDDEMIDAPPSSKSTKQAKPVTGPGHVHNKSKVATMKQHKQRSQNTSSKNQKTESVLKNVQTPVVKPINSSKPDKSKHAATESTSPQARQVTHLQNDISGSTTSSATKQKRNATESSFHGVDKPTYPQDPAIDHATNATTKQKHRHLPVDDKTEGQDPSLDAIYADIIDYTNYNTCIRALEPPGNSRFAKLLRRIKKFVNLRVAAGNRPVLQVDQHAELLGVILKPPTGSSHFDVQLTLCGLLRKNAASAYELYHFFLENGFYDHLPAAPTYEVWSMDFKQAIAAENSFYREGIRVSITGEMDYLRDVFAVWCDSWHDYRLARPIPGFHR